MSWSSLRRGLGYSQASVAEYLGVSRQLLMRLEQGLYSEPSHLEALAALYDITETELLEHYRENVKKTREDFAEGYPTFKAMLRDYTGTTHPLVVYRERVGLSQIGFCKALCLHPDPVRDYEMNNQRGIPRQLIDACNMIGWDYGPLESAVTEWRIKGHAERLRA